MNRRALTLIVHQKYAFDYNFHIFLNRQFWYHFFAKSDLWLHLVWAVWWLLRQLIKQNKSVIFNNENQ